MDPSQNRAKQGFRWPWSRETRQQSSYTDTLIQTLVNQASGQPVATPLATAALEAAAGAVGRAFASAEPEGSPDIVSALTPGALGMIGRELIRTGECVCAISIVEGRVQLRRRRIGTCPDQTRTP